jgi:hypothetical protein
MGDLIDIRRPKQVRKGKEFQIEKEMETKSRGGSE